MAGRRRNGRVYGGRRGPAALPSGLPSRFRQGRTERRRATRGLRQGTLLEQPEAIVRYLWRPQAFQSVLRQTRRTQSSSRLKRRFHISLKSKRASQACWDGNQVCRMSCDHGQASPGACCVPIVGVRRDSSRCPAAWFWLKNSRTTP